MPRRGNVAQEVIEHLFSGNEETYFIVGIRERAALPTKQLNQRLMLCRKFRKTSLIETHGRTTCKLTGTRPAYKMFPFTVSAEKEINDQPHSLHRLTVFQNHHQHLAQNYKQVKSTKYTINYHIEHVSIRFLYNKHTKKY